ncbi:uncharacterized protein LOC124817563 isoform X1 [Hydra vulgaris]|uniref:uncharacterized protein LOC124817563 isoform X1 n=1 Tax=Hydra vulgaris TaxID=6087 RepID=UPI001F5FC09C|nr:uncharacterized protein LOC124817563 [Hydra vulgaris]
MKLAYFNILVYVACFEVERFDFGDIFYNINKETCKLIKNSVWVANLCKCLPNYSTYFKIHGKRKCYNAADLYSELELENDYKKVFFLKSISDTEYVYYDEIYSLHSNILRQEVNLSSFENSTWILISDASINFTQTQILVTVKKNESQLTGRILRLSFNFNGKQDVLLKISGIYKPPYILLENYWKRLHLGSFSTDFSELSNFIPNFSTTLISPLKILETTKQPFHKTNIKSDKNGCSSNQSLIIGINIGVFLILMICCFIICRRVYKRIKKGKPILGDISKLFLKSNGNTQAKGLAKVVQFGDKDIYINPEELNIDDYQQLHLNISDVRNNGSGYHELNTEVIRIKDITKTSISYRTVSQDSCTSEYTVPSKSTDLNPKSFVQLIQAQNSIDEVNIESDSLQKYHSYFTIE